MTVEGNRTGLTGGAWRAAAGLVPPLAALLVSWNTIPGSFIFDDAVIVQGDERLRSFDLRRIFLENYWGSAFPTPNWRPLTTLTFALNHRLSSAPWGFHLVNVALYCAAAWCVYLLLRSVCRSPWAAAAGGAIFAALPIHSEAVANVVGRAELLAALGAVSAWGLALKGPASPGGCLAIGLLTLGGMLSKESAAVAPVLIAVSALVLRRKLPWRAILSALAGVLIYLALQRLIFSGVPSGAAGAALVDNPLSGEPFLTRATNGVRFLGLYFFRTVLPLHLSADHSWHELPVLSISQPGLWCQAGLAVLAFALPAALALRRAPAVALGFLTFPLAFAVTANVLFPIGTMFAERLAFLPSAGWAIALAGGLEMLAGRGPRARRAALFLAVALIAAYGTRTWIRNRIWADPVTFGLQLAVDAPGSARAHLKAAEAHLTLAGSALGAAARDEELRLAEAELNAAAAIKEDETFAHRAMLLVEYERYPEALELVRRAKESYRRERLELDPRVLFLEARVHYLLGNLSGALRALADSERRQPALPPPAIHLRGACRMGLGQLAEAKPDLDEAVRLDPENGVHHMDRGVLLAQLGRTEEARAELERAVSLAPANPQVYVNRGYLRFLTGDGAGALADYRKGLEICERLGRLTAVRGESVLGFRRKIFDLLLRSGDREGAQRELEAVRAIPGEAAAGAARALEAQLASGGLNR